MAEKTIGCLVIRMTKIDFIDEKPPNESNKKYLESE